MWMVELVMTTNRASARSPRMTMPPLPGHDWTGSERAEMVQARSKPHHFKRLLRRHRVAGNLRDERDVFAREYFRHGHLKRIDRPEQRRHHAVRGQASAADGADALDQLHDHPADAILLDLIMPVMDGWSFLDAISQDADLRSIPVGIMSAVPALHQAAREQGVHVAVGKPFAMDELIAQVECLLSEVPSKDG